MSLYDHPYFYFGMPVSYVSWIDGRDRFPGRDATRRYDRFYHKRKPKKRFSSHYHAHFGDHVRYSNGQTVRWIRNNHDPHGSIYGQLKETLSFEQSQRLYDYTDLYLYWRKQNKKMTRPFYEGILRRMGYSIGRSSSIRRLEDVID